MKTFAYIGLIAGLLFMSHAQAHAEFRDYHRQPSWRDHRPLDWVDARQHQQQRRIEHGIYSGRLSPSELNKLQRNQEKIARLEYRFKSDGRLSHSEQRILDKKLDRVSDQIDYLKHNERYGREAYRFYQTPVSRQNSNRGGYYPSRFEGDGYGHHPVHW